MLENLSTILSVAGTAIGLLITTVTFLMKFVKSSKAKKSAENIIKVGSAIEQFIVEAEKFTHYSGAEKKAYVMSLATSFAVKNGIDVDDSVISDKIEEIVALSKKVNPRLEDVINGESANGDN